MGFAIAGLVIGLLGTAISTYAAYSQNQELQKAAKAEAAFRNQEAESLRQSAAFQERQYRTRLAVLLGQQQAISAASGVDISSGSPLLMQLNNVRQGEMEALNIRRTGEVGASGKELEARLARMRAGFLNTQSGYILGAGAFKAGSSILSGWSTYYNQSKPINPNRVQEN